MDVDEKVNIIIKIWYTHIKREGGKPSLVLYVNHPITWPLVEEMTLDFACRMQMGSMLLSGKFNC